MYARSFVFALWSLAGCDAIIENAAAPETAILGDVEILAAHQRTPGGESWDSESGETAPDLYLSLRIGDEAVEIRGRGRNDEFVAVNVGPANVPAKTVTERTIATMPARPAQVDQIDQRLSVQLWDADLDGDQLVADLGSVVLRQAQREFFGQRTAIDFSSADGASQVRLFWIWS